MTQVNFRIEEDVKNNAEKALKDMGLTMSAAITMFQSKLAERSGFRSKSMQIPFTVQKILLNLKDGLLIFEMAAVF